MAEHEPTPVPEDYTIFERFADREHASPLLAVLEEAGIPHHLETVDGVLTTGISGPVTVQAFALHLPEDQHEAAHHAVNASVAKQGSRLPEDHFLHAFGEDDFHEMFARPDEWLDTDQELALEMLASRGTPMADAEVTRLREARRAELAQPEPGAGLITGAYVCALAGGVMGIVLGRNLANMTKTTFYGDEVPQFDAAAQAHGKRAERLGILVLVLLAAFLVWQYAL